MTWKASDPDVPRTPLLQIRMGRSGFGLIPRTLPGVLKMLKTRKIALSYASRDPGHLLSFEIGSEYVQMQSSEIQEDPSLIQTYFHTHIVNGVFLRDKQQCVYEEMLRLQGLGANTLTGAPYTDDQIMAIVRQGKQRGQIPDVGRVLAGRGKDLKKQMDMIMKVVRSDEKMSQLLLQLQSPNEAGSGSGSGGGGDDAPGYDEDAGENEEDEDS
nr:hypothetical protein [Tanacetum cinerariifolium]